jgi:hypothetical protein
MLRRSIALRRFSRATVLAGLALLLLAPPASASFHLNKIREISGSTAGTDSAYIELQMYANGENLVSGHNITLWDADGLLLGMPIPIQTLTLTGPNPPNGQTQRTILIGDTGVPGRDFTLDFTPYIETGGGGGNNLIAAGAACYEGIPVDCFSWGAFTGAANLPDKATPYGQPMPTTFALRRIITRGCATALDTADDTNNNAADFTAMSRAPRNNATTPTETLCGNGGGGGNAGTPNTKIKKRPKNRSMDTSPTWKFKSTEPGSTFKCKLDRKKFRKCRSPKTYHGVKPGKHTFKVEAIDADGNVDKTPAKDKFVVLP